MLLLLAALAHAGPDVLLVTTPGWRLEAYEPLVGALREGGSAVVPVVFPCSGDRDDALALIERASRDLAPGYVVVAHGFGATLSLQAHEGLSPSRYVLLAPVLDLWPTAVARWLAAQPVSTSVDLGEPAVWEGQDAKALLLGGPAPLGCVAPRLAAEVQAWVQAGRVPIALERVDAPVWIGLGLLDEVAGVEAVVPAARRLPDRELVRLGITRMDPRDFDHLGMLTDPVPVRAAANAVRLSEAR